MERISVSHKNKKHKLEILFLPLFFVSFFISSQSACGQTTLTLYATWTAPTTDSDSMPLNDLASFNLYRTDTGRVTRINSSPIPTTYGTAASPYQFSVQVSGAGKLTFYATAVDIFGNESAPSRRASYPYDYDSPIIISLSPASGTAGTIVTIRGNHFGPSEGSSGVSFNSVSATVTSWSNTAIKCTVPSGATAGPVAVETSIGASNGKTFTVKPPAITAVSPTSGTVGTVVTIAGNYFGPSQGSSGVSFNSISATVTSWSNTAIKCTVPSGATTGPVVVETSVGVSNGKTFAVKLPAIAALSPTSGAVGTAVIIRGNYFGPSQGSSGVSFNSVSATVTSWSNTAIRCTVPSGVTSGPVVVTTTVGASNGKTFTVKP